MDLNTFSTNDERVNEGAWHNLGAGKIRVARANNKKYLSVLQAKLNKHPELDRNTEEGDALYDSIITEAIGETILTDWEEIKDNNEYISYTPFNATAMLKKYHDFREYVVGLSLNNDHYRTNKIKAIEGKLKAPSSGVGSTEAE